MPEQQVPVPVLEHRTGPGRRWRAEGGSLELEYQEMMDRKWMQERADRLEQEQLARQEQRTEQQHDQTKSSFPWDIIAFGIIAMGLIIGSQFVAAFIRMS